MQTTTLYDQDFYAWTQRQIDLLQARQWNQVDIENLIEELDSLGKQQRQELYQFKKRMRQMNCQNPDVEGDSQSKIQNPKSKMVLRNRLGVLLGHLLKWRYQPEDRSRSWTGTIREQRRRIKEHLADNPSLKPYLSEAIERGYQDGLDLMEKETPFNPKHLPQSCPFSEAEIFDDPVEMEE